jgi:hypothetical protein
MAGFQVAAEAGEVRGHLPGAAKDVIAFLQNT